MARKKPIARLKRELERLQGRPAAIRGGLKRQQSMPDLKKEQLRKACRAPLEQPPEDDRNGKTK